MKHLTDARHIVINKQNGLHTTLKRLLDCRFLIGLADLLPVCNNCLAATHHSYISLQPSKSKDECGTLLIAGSMNWDITGRKSLPKGCKDIGKNLWSPHTLASMEGKRVRLVASGSNACHCVLVNEEGQAMSWGEFLDAIK